MRVRMLLCALCVCPHTQATICVSAYACYYICATGAEEGTGALYVCPHTQATKYATTYALQELKKALARYMCVLIRIKRTPSYSYRS